VLIAPIISIIDRYVLSHPPHAQPAPTQS
jgi:hypothetical protein